jgi:biopolymer transport protein ExbB/TolQ
MPNDSTVCTSVENVKKTAIRIITLEAEREKAIEIAAVSEVTEEVVKEKSSKEIKRINRKLKITKIIGSVTAIPRAVMFITIGYITGKVL